MPRHAHSDRGQHSILAFLVRRILLLIPVSLGAMTVVFSLIHVIPGDPVEAMLGEGAFPSDVEELRDRLHLNEPLLIQYRDYLRGVATGDLGTSFRTRQPVLHEIGKRLPNTFLLALFSISIAGLVALPFGVTAAVKKGSLADAGSMFFALLGVSVPGFFLGPMLIVAFSIKLGWLPVSGMGGVSHLILPGITLGLALSALLARMTRASMLDQLQENYVSTARSKGLPERTVVYSHALANGLLPIVTVLGLQFGALLTGAIITEEIFSWPGLGSYLIESIRYRDYPCVQGCILVFSLIYISVNFLTDIVYGIVDPRVRLS
jgi:peptide/nickel transport system permease protein